jgi:hypothetical protein
MTCLRSQLSGSDTCIYQRVSLELYFMYRKVMKAQSEAFIPLCSTEQKVICIYQYAVSIAKKIYLTKKMFDDLWLFNRIKVFFFYIEHSRIYFKTRSRPCTLRFMV